MKHTLMKHDSIKFPKETSYVDTYNDIISAIASGANKVNEIADKTHVEQSVAVHACKHYTLICGVTGKLDYFVTTVGRWWGNASRETCDNGYRYCGIR